MFISKFLALPRKGAGYCTTLVALAILAAPGLAWAQCNSDLNIALDPAKAGYVNGGVDDRYRLLGQDVQVQLRVGSGDIGGAPLAVSQFRTALDCKDATQGPLSDCLGYLGADPALEDDGDAILSLGGFSITGAFCDAYIAGGGQFIVNGGAGFPGSPGSPAALPNLITIDAVPAIEFPANTNCMITYDIRLNNFGTVLDNNPSFPGVQFLYAGTGFDAACGATSANIRASQDYQFKSTPLIEIIKEVSVDGGPWLSVAVGTYPASTGEYRLLVTNPAATTDPITAAVLGEPLENVLLNDTTLDLVNVPLPDRCYVNGVFPSGATCTIDSGDALFGNLGGVDVCRTYPDPLINEACTQGDGLPSGITAGPVCDVAEVLCVGTPDLTIKKYVEDPDNPGNWLDAQVPNGPTYPVGAVVPYRLVVCNTGTLDLTDVQVYDPDLGIVPPVSIGPLPATDPDSCITLEEGLGPVTGLDSPIPCSLARQFENIAYADGYYVGGGPETRQDPANVICQAPEMHVEKDGEPEAKVGDWVDYDVCAFNDSAFVALTNCEATDTLPGVTLPGPFDLAPSGQTGDEYCYQYTYQVPDGPPVVPGDPDTLPNIATVECEVVGVDPLVSPANATIMDDDDWSLDLFVIEGNMVKTCAPASVPVGSDICWNIMINNTGDRDFSCVINDTTANITDADLSVPAGGNASLPEVCREVLVGEAGSTISNTATAICTPSNVLYDNDIDVCEDPAGCSADCEVPGDALCRTPGFWKTHAGIEKANRSTNLTQTVIDHSDVMDVDGSGDGTYGLGDICGVRITDTTTYEYPEGTGSGDSNGSESAVEGMCVHPKQRIVRQLQRQLIAASLNCVISNGRANCAGVSISQEWMDANEACTTVASGGTVEGGLSQFIDPIDDFNNGKGCSDNIKLSSVFDGVIADGDKVPGPAGSSNACSEATGNDFYLVPLP